MLETKEETLAKRIAFHEKESHKFTQEAKHSTDVKGLLKGLKEANWHSKQVAFLVAELRGWGQTSIHHL